MKKHKPLLVVSSYHRYQEELGENKKCMPLLQYPTRRRSIQSRKNQTNSLQNKYLEIQQRQQLRSSTANPIRPMFNTIAIQQLDRIKKKNDIANLFIGTFRQGYEQNLFVERNKSPKIKYTLLIKKQKAKSDVICKSLLQPCQITSAVFNERDRSTDKSRLTNRDFVSTRISNFTSRRTFRHSKKAIVQQLQPWKSENIELDENNF